MYPQRRHILQLQRYPDLNPTRCKYVRVLLVRYRGTDAVHGVRTHVTQPSLRTSELYQLVDRGDDAAAVHYTPHTAVVTTVVSDVCVCVRFLCRPNISAGTCSIKQYDVRACSTAIWRLRRLRGAW